MQVAGRLCEGCGEAVTRLGDGDGCGSCDVVVCATCLKGTARCPSCQRPFDETRDAAPHAERKSDAVLDRGRRQVVAVGVSLAGSVLVVGVLGGAPITTVFVQLFVLGLLMLQLFRGRGWARWILVGLTALAAFGNASQGFSVFAGGPWVHSFALATVYAWCALVLAFSGSVTRFLRTQRLRNP